MELDLVTTGAVFVSAFGVNALGSLGIRRCAEGKALEASLIDSAVLLLSAVAIYAFVSQPFYLAPEALGCFLGSYLAIKKDSQKDGDNKMILSESESVVDRANCVIFEYALREHCLAEKRLKICGCGNCIAQHEDAKDRMAWAAESQQYKTTRKERKARTLDDADWIEV